MLVAALLVGCDDILGGGEAFTASWDFDQCELSQNATLSGGGSSRALSWTDCRIWVDSDLTKSAIVQFAIPGTSGSFASPGNGWLSLSIPLAGATQQFRSDYIFPDGTRALVSHNIGAEAISFDRSSARFSSSLSTISFQTGGGQMWRFGGSALASAATGGESAEGGSGTGSSSTAPSGARCQALVNQCAAGGIAPCYCAAACAYAAAGDRAGEQGERAKAQQLGTTCSY